jgi:hypothetical protein
MRKRLGLAMALVLAALSGLGIAGAEEKAKHVDPQGEPAGFKAGEGNVYAVWHNKHGWHLRTTTAKKLHHFTGYVKVEGGSFTKIHSHHLEKEGRCEDHWAVSSDKTEVKFDFKTDKGIDGIDFHLSKDAKHLKFNLHVDGKHHAKKVLIGKGAHHPAHDPFTLPAHPHGK